MTHPHPGDEAATSRRARRNSKKQERVRRVSSIAAISVLAVVFGLFATETVRIGGGDGPTFAGAGAVHAQVSTTSLPTTTTLPARKCRSPLTDPDPLRLWVGGDSLAGSLGPSLGTIAGATGVVQPYFDSRVSSGLTNPTFFDWPSHAEKEMARLNPEVVVFIIGANDYLAPTTTTTTTTTSTTVDPSSPSAVNTTVPVAAAAEPWKVDYAQRVDAMLTSLSAPDRTVIWVGPPPFKNEQNNAAIQQISEVSKAVIAMHPNAVFVDDYAMFLDVNGKYTDRLPDANGNLIPVRSGDGVHFTTEGGNQLARAVFSVIDTQCQVTAQAVAGVVKPTIQTEGSTLVAPGSNNRPGTVATTPPATSPQNTTPAATTPANTAPPETTPSTSPPTTAPATTPSSPSTSTP
jgi:hypothetical protein